MTTANAAFPDVEVRKSSSHEFCLIQIEMGKSPWQPQINFVHVDSATEWPIAESVMTKSSDEHIVA